MKDKDKSKKLDLNNEELKLKLIVKNTDLGLLFTVLLTLIMVWIAGNVSSFTPNVIDLLKGKSNIKQPVLEKSDFDKRNELIESQNIKTDKEIKLLKEPIITPPYYVDTEKLKNYLISKSVSIKVFGKIESAYLYVKTDSLNLENESVSFYIVDGKPVTGHLFAPLSIFSRGDNEFIYDLKNLPLVDLPYSIKKTPTTHDVVDVLNNASEKENLYIGAMVSTTTLPNQVEQIEIKYNCVNKGNCEIRILE